jgi:hypothetical protein
MHLSYTFGIVKSSSNLVESGASGKLKDNATLRILQHRIVGEIQPSRHLSVGAMFAFDQMKLGDPRSQLSVTNSGLSDQRIWGEYRFLDQLGSSLGLAIMVKFPGYKNPTTLDLQSQGLGSTALLGDAQTDLTGLVTGEFWLSKNFRTRTNFGLTLRTEGYASEFPFLISMGYVSPKIDFDLRIRGNLSLQNDALSESVDAPGIDELRQAFAGSNYALASNPRVIVVNPVVEIWTSTKNAFSFEYQYSFTGLNSPRFHFFGFGWISRWASNKRTRAKTFQQVDMSTQQEADQFQGELYDRDAEPTPEDDDEIQEEPN